MNKLRIVAIFGIMLVLLLLSACYTLTETPVAERSFLMTPVQPDLPCEACAQATLAVALTQQKDNTDNQAAATAEIVRANAQATLNSANATLGVALTQDQNNANALAAQIAASAEIVRANAQATLNSASSTQSAALTQDVIHQTQISDMATAGAVIIINQQFKNELAAGTQTAIDNNIATQTQAAVATSQWYVDQARQREERRQGPIAFLWIWCFPIFILLLAGLVIWGFWRWLKIKQDNLRILENPVERLQAPEAEIIDASQEDSLPHIESNILDNDYQLTRPDDQVRRWLEEVKRKLLRSDRKDDEDNGTDS